MGLFKLFRKDKKKNEQAASAEPVKPEIHSRLCQWGATYSLRCGSVLGMMNASIPVCFIHARRVWMRSLMVSFIIHYIKDV